ncbi:unnamed protein product [Calypogeia fissa]
MGGPFIEGFRDWCRRRWTGLNLPEEEVSGEAGEEDGSELISTAEETSSALKLYKEPKQQQQQQARSQAISTPVNPVRAKAEEQPRRTQSQDPRRKNMVETEFFTEYGEANRYQIQEVIGKGSYGVVCSAIDTHTGEKVAIKKINDIFEHVSDATRILREIKLLRLLRHPDIVEVKHIMVPPSRREFKDIYVVFELMESDLHQVIKANDDLTPEHYQFFLYQLLRALKYIHTANVFHRDLKPKNVLANADCKLKICDFGLARVAFNDAPTTIFWTDYVATRWYRAPELCGSFFAKYTPAIDIWSIGCIFAEVLTGRPLFPGKNVVHQLDLMTDMLGSPSAEAVARVRNEKARRYLSSMRKKAPMPFSQKFPNADPLAIRLLERMLAFDPRDRPTAEEALADAYFKGLAKVEREPSAQPITKMEFEFERRRINKDDVRELIYREILEYHPQMLKEYLNGTEHANFMYPSAVDQFKRQFAHLEDNYGKNGNNGNTVQALERQHASLPRPCMLYTNSVPPEQVAPFSGRERVMEFREEAAKYARDNEKQLPERGIASLAKGPIHASQKVSHGGPAKPGKVVGSGVSMGNGGVKESSDARRLVKCSSVSGSQYPSSLYSYGRRNAGKVDREDKRDEASELNAVQSKTESMGIGVTRKVSQSGWQGHNV